MTDDYNECKLSGFPRHCLIEVTFEVESMRIESEGCSPLEFWYPQTTDHIVCGNRAVGKVT